MELPFEEELNEGYHVRTFSSDVNELELKWHWDKEDRIVICEHQTDWKFQYDEELPISINKNSPIYIGKGQYHRIIKGTGDLILKVKKLS